MHRQEMGGGRESARIGDAGLPRQAGALTYARAIIAAVVVLAIAAGCGSFGRNAEPTPLPPAELTLLSFGSEGSWGVAEEALTDLFREQQPNVEFKISDYGEPPSTYLAVSPVPDIMVISPGYLLNQAIANGQILDLTDLWQQAGLAEDYPAGLRELSAWEGKQYFVPVANTWTAIYYNKEIFEQYGLAPPQTWDEFISVSETLLDNGVTPLSIAGNDVFLNTLWFDYLDLRLNGLDFHRQMLNGEISYQDERVRTVFEVWGNLVDRGYFGEAPARVGARDSVMAIVPRLADVGIGGKAAMTLSGPTWLGDLPPELQDGLDFFAFPVIDPSVPKVEALTSYGYMVPSEAPNRDAALAYVEYAGSAPAQTAIAPRLNAGGAGLAPANPGAEWGDVPESVQRGSTILTDASGLTPIFVLAAPDAMWDSAGRAIGYFLQNPWDVETTTMMLEEARQAALAAGAFLQAE
jgi:multiple sugar transport system substrate-binding protein